MAVPSEWVEQARVTSPDGKLDAVIVHADPTEALQTAPAEGPSKLVPVEGKGETESRVLSVRVVPKGAKTERARPFPFPTSQFMDRLAEQSAFVSSYTPEVKVSWADDSTLLIQSGPARVVHQAQEITLADGAASRRVSVTYSPATPTN